MITGAQNLVEDRYKVDRGMLLSLILKCVSLKSMIVFESTTLIFLDYFFVYLFCLFFAFGPDLVKLGT